MYTRERESVNAGRVIAVALSLVNTVVVELILARVMYTNTAKRQRETVAMLRQ